MIYITDMYLSLFHILRDEGAEVYGFGDFILFGNFCEIRADFRRDEKRKPRIISTLDVFDEIADDRGDSR